MKVIKRYNQHRRDLSIDMECERCEEKQINTDAYDDTNFWQNVVPNFKCPRCGESTNSLGKEIGSTTTKYPDGMSV